MSSRNEILTLIMDYLYSENLHSSLVALEKESSQSIFKYNNQLAFLRKLIFDGKFDDAVNYLNPLRKQANFDYKEAVFLLKEEKFLESIECDFKLDQNDLEAQLDDIKKYSSAINFQKLLGLLNENSIKDTDDYFDWSKDSARLHTYEKIREILQPIFPGIPENEKTVPTGLLKKAIIKAVGERSFNGGRIIDSLNLGGNKNNHRPSYSNNSDNNNNEPKYQRGGAGLMTKSPRVMKNDSFNEGERPYRRAESSNQLTNQFSGRLSRSNTNIQPNTRQQANKITSSQNVIPSNPIFNDDFVNPYADYVYDPSSFDSECLLTDTQPIRTCCFDPTGEYLLLGTNSRSLKFYSFSSVKNKFINRDFGDKIGSLPLLYEQPNFHLGSIYTVDWSANGKIVASGSNDKLIKILVVPDLKELESQLGQDDDLTEPPKIDPWIMQLAGHQGTVRSLAFDPVKEHNLLSAGSVDTNIFVWDCVGNLSYTLAGHMAEINAVKHSTRKEFNVFGSVDKTGIVNFWDLKSKKPINTIEIDKLGEINDISFTPDFLAAAHKEGVVSIWDYNTGKLRKEIKCNIERLEARSVNFSKDEKYLICSGFDKKIRIFDVRNNFSLCKTLDHNDKVVCSIWHPDIPVITSTSCDKTAKIWLPRIY